LLPKEKEGFQFFWGDQLFIPTNEIQEVHHEVDLLVKLLPKIPDSNTWAQENYHKYGLVILNEQNSFKQLEKLNYESFKELNISTTEKVGLSLGSFSLSKRMLEELLHEFDSELTHQKGKMDTDPHLWMPLSLDFKTYLNIFKKKNLPEAVIQFHYERMQIFKAKFLEKTKNPLLGASDLGGETLWWDYGNRASYHQNILKITEKTEEGEAMRTFFSIPKDSENHVEEAGLKIENSTLINCSIRKGSIKNSVLINVFAEEVNLENSVLIQASAQKVDAKGAILYNIAENGPLIMEDAKVRADNFSKKYGHVKLYNSIHSPTPWDQCAKENPFSFAKLYQLNQGLHPSEGQLRAQTAHNQVKQAVINLQIQEKE